MYCTADYHDNDDYDNNSINHRGSHVESNCWANVETVAESYHSFADAQSDSSASNSSGKKGRIITPVYFSFCTFMNGIDDNLFFASSSTTAHPESKLRANPSADLRPAHHQISYS